MSDPHDSRAELTRDILDLLARQNTHSDSTAVLSPAQYAQQAPGAPANTTLASTPSSARRLEFGIMFFAAAAGDKPGVGLYTLAQKAAIAADQLGLSAIWLPERHFHRFGGPYPAPAVLAAALAGVTKQIRLRSGSITLPLNHPLRVVEAWSMIDHLSGGRVELGFGSGWSPNDFVLAPDNFTERKALLHQRIDEVLRLWRGEAVSYRNGIGEQTPVQIYPKPLQNQPPIWIMATGNPDTFAWAGSHGHNILTMLLGSSLADLKPRVERYRQARRQAGLDPAAGRVGLMLHSLVHPDEQRVLAAIHEPFTRYVSDALDAQRHASAEGRQLDPAQRAQMVAYATERYTRTAALFGRPESCFELLDAVAASDVDEIACLIDFGPDDELVLEGLPHIAALRERWHQRTALAATPIPQAADPLAIAVIGMSATLPGVPNIQAQNETIQTNASALGPAPAGRFASSDPSLSRGGFIADVELFDPALFRLAPAEAAAMDPHQRLLLTMAHHCFLDAGLSPDSLAGSAVGVFTALYSDSFAARKGSGETSDPLAATGRIHALAANRISHIYDLAGPSEVIATACSSGLVAVHRALRALRAGECELALVCAASLLLSDAESRTLRTLGVLSPTDRCLPFDRAADGQCRGEGAAALLLKPLADAMTAGDPIDAVILGSATNHAGAASGSLLLPNANRQAACIAKALADAQVALSSIGYVEMHGAGSLAGDHAELAALAELWRNQDRGTADDNPEIAIASGKAAYGSLDAVGGLAAMVRTITALRDGLLPALAAGGDLDADNPLQATPFYLNRSPRPWRSPDPAQPRRAGVHAYGLGGVNAHIILEAPPVSALNVRRQGNAPMTSATMMRFPLDGGPTELASAANTAGLDPPPRSVVADFYDYVTRESLREFSETYLTLAPFSQPVPGFSWTRTMQNPKDHPVHHQLMLERQQEMRAVAFSAVDFSTVKRVMDIGCGLGTDLIMLAKTHPGLAGVGYTLSAEQARIAKTRSSAQGLSEQLDLQHQDSSQTPFPGIFELIFGFEVVHHIADKEGLFSNIAAALAPTGHLALADTLSGTVAPVNLAEIGSYTLPRSDYAALFARHGLLISECLDLSAEIANFLIDPQLEAMLATEERIAATSGRASDFPLAAKVQRGWNAFGEALREGLMFYVLIHAQATQATQRDTLDANLQALEVA